MTEETGLRTVLGDHGQVAALKSGEVDVEGFSLAFETIKPMTTVYRRMAREAEFDICELAPTTYLAARDQGVPITALPLPMTRRFRHSGIVRPEGSDIVVPKDLELCRETGSVGLASSRRARSEREWSQVVRAFSIRCAPILMTSTIAPIAAATRPMRR